MCAQRFVVVSLGRGALWHPDEGKGSNIPLSDLLSTDVPGLGRLLTSGAETTHTARAQTRKQQDSEVRRAAAQMQRHIYSLRRKKKWESQSITYTEVVLRNSLESSDVNMNQHEPVGAADQPKGKLTGSDYPVTIN